MRVSDYIKPKTQSTIGRVKVIFAPYSAEELHDIVKARVKDAFKPNVVSDAVMEKIADIEATRGGDARKALELVDVCAKIAVAKGSKKVGLEYVDAAVRTLEKDELFSLASTLTKHQKILYLGMLKTKASKFTGEKVYKLYKEVCAKQNVQALTVRSIRTFLVNLSELGLIKSEVGWLKDLRKKSRTITIDVDTATRKKLRKLIRDSI